jgi:hypothetical protein
MMRQGVSSVEGDADEDIAGSVSMVGENTIVTSITSVKESRVIEE